MTTLRAIFLLGSALALAACGADDVASPGQGVIISPPSGGGNGGGNNGGNGGGNSGDLNAAPCPTHDNIQELASRVAGHRVCQVSGVVTKDLTLESLEGVLYSLRGGVRIGVDVGGDGNKAGGQSATLFVDPGVLIYGSSGADFLLIERGSKINAVGTADKPIIFTSAANVRGESGADSIGEWGGILLLGRAPINTCIGNVQGGAVNCEAQIEGADGFYGGATPNDSSGRMEYVQVRFPGFEVTPGNELNGITMGGVGSGTVFEHIQVHNSSDDGIEWFGGTANGKYLVVTGADDDSLDTDLGYTGFNQFVLVEQRSTGGDFVIEADSDGNDLLTPRSRPVFANFTFIGKRTSNAAVMMRGGTDYGLYNGIITSTTTACLQLRAQQTVAPANAALDEQGPPVVASTFLSCTTPAAGHGGSNVTEQQVLNVLTGNNNELNGTSTLINTYFPGANENAVPAFADLAGVNAYLTNVNYIGAFRDANDNWFNGWTCGLPGQTSCTAAARPVR